MNRLFLHVLIALTVLSQGVLGSSRCKQKVTIKIATLAPPSSYWYDAILKISSEVKKKTNGCVQFNIFAGGVAGDEGDMLRKMRLGSIDAAILSFVGMGSFEELFKGFWFPLFYDSLKEADWFYQRLKSNFDGRLYKKKFKMLTSVGVGPVYWFSKDPIQVPADIKKQKIFVWAGDVKGTELWKELGFQPVPLSMVDLASSLKTGMVKAFSNIPVYASAYQLHTVVKHMLKLEWSYILAGFMIRVQTMNKLSNEHKEILENVVNSVKSGLEEQAQIENDKALQAMQKEGLKIYTPNNDQKKIWYAELKKNMHKFQKIMPKSIITKFKALKKKSPFAKKKETGKKAPIKVPTKDSVVPPAKESAAPPADSAPAIPVGDG